MRPSALDLMMTLTHLARSLTVLLLAAALSGCASKASPEPEQPPAPAAGPAFDPWAAGDRVWIAMETIRVGGYAVGDLECGYGGLANHPIIRLSAVPPGTDHLEAYVESWELSSGVRAGYDVGDGRIQALPDVRGNAVWFKIEVPHGAFETNETTWGFYAIHVLPGTTEDCYDGFAFGDSSVEFYAVKGAGGCPHEAQECGAGPKARAATLVPPAGTEAATHVAPQPGERDQAVAGRAGTLPSKTMQAPRGA